jgi:N6-L-threonylcarbamoyladenine synthase
MKILGIETSCDDTGIGIGAHDKKILSNIVFSQIKEHAPYKGVVPEIASRSHMKALDIALGDALKEADIELDDIDAIAATAGPGLIGGVIVGTMFGISLAYGLGKAYIAINHLEGHLLSPRITNDLEFPYLMLLVSGGHTQFVAALGLGHYKILGSSLDDAVGEAFDKTGKMLGIEYPAGPLIEKLALEGDPKRFTLPMPLRGRRNPDFSFSGLKTAVRDLIANTSDVDMNDICASFQFTVGEILKERTKKALDVFAEISNSKNFAIAGGVGANLYLRVQLESILLERGFKLYAPPMSLCTDNGVMIAWAGLERFKAGLVSSQSFAPKAVWALDS